MPTDFVDGASHRSAVFPYALIVFAAGWLAACTSEPAGPVACDVASECVDLVDTPDCDRGRGVCAAPCTADQTGTFACEAGVRNYCDTDPALPCTVCPSVCGTGTWCDEANRICAPVREAAEACTTDAECASGACTAAGLCSVAQGEECTAETCEGACAETNGGSTHCIRRCDRSVCDASTAGGFEWECVTLTTLPGEPAYCVPVDFCGPPLVLGGAEPCGSFVDGRCGTACPSEGCFNFCVPDSLGAE